MSLLYLHPLFYLCPLLLRSSRSISFFLSCKPSWRISPLSVSTGLPMLKIPETELTPLMPCVVLIPRPHSFQPPPLSLLICLAVPRLPVFWIPLSPVCDSINMKSRRGVCMFSCLYNVPLLNSPLSLSVSLWASLALSVYLSSSSAGDRMAAAYIQFLVSSLLHPVYPLKYSPLSQLTGRGSAFAAASSSST